MDYRNRHTDPGQNQQTTHRWGSRLRLMRRWAFFPNNLSEFQPVQQRDGDRAQQNHHAECAKRTEYQRLHELQTSDCGANASSSFSIVMPREPLSNRVSPGNRIFRSNAIAAG